jgi:anhydro-N-acetylmuramic acid kinase
MNNIKKIKFAGIMTGTSIDAIDVSISNFWKNENDEFQFKLIAYKEYNFPEGIKELILRITGNNFTIRELSQLNFLLAEIYADSLKKLCQDTGIKLTSIYGLGVHGQTLWHEPDKNDFYSHQISSTLQFVNISALSMKLNGMSVYGDFRSADVALGGQGAPLIPIFDYHFLRSTINDVIALNIGGMANITFLPKNCQIDKVIAFDTGPGNVLIDYAINVLFGMNYDKDGDIAKNGQIISNIFENLKSEPFISKKPPKSTGRELFNDKFVLKHFTNNNKPSDIICTLTEFTAWSIAENIKNAMQNIENSESAEIVVSGGGRKNSFLIGRIKYYLPDYEIINIDNLNINGDAKESICFGFLAYLNYLGIPANIPSVTGAEREVILGVRAGNNNL